MGMASLACGGLAADGRRGPHLPCPPQRRGAVLAVIVWVVASAALHYYVLNFANYSVMYGALGAVLMLLLYFYISAAVLLLGAEVNAVIRDASRRGGGEGG